MINSGVDVPENVIAIFKTADNSLTDDRLNSILFKSPKRRDWFEPNFYRCLPLAIGNQYGFQIACEFDFGVKWDGTNNTDAITFYFNKEEKELSTMFPMLSSHFGNGILTITVPFLMRTSPGVNIMTINPPNSIVENMTVMTGVVETDNLRHNFTFNIRIQKPNEITYYKSGTPLAAFIPIPRYFADGFELVMAEDIFDQETIDEEMQSVKDFFIQRTDIDPNLPNEVNRQYFNGTDVYGNNFSDHQKAGR
jgi:hypothetical protein